MKKNIFIDTDVGCDDLIAIGMLLLSKRFQIKGISVADGITDLEQGINNLARIFTWIKTTNIPLVSGTKLIRKKVPFPLDTQRTNNLTLLSRLPVSKTASKDITIFPSIEALYSLISKSKEKSTLVCLGPLTNIAILIREFGQKFTSKISQVFLMGGAVDAPGIVPPWNLAEYNVFINPKAAKIVFNTDLPVTMISTDATQWVPAMPQITKNQKVKQRLREFYGKLKSFKPNNKIKRIIREIILRNEFDFNYFYDPLVTAVFLNPKIIKSAFQSKIKVVLSGKNRGQTKKSMDKNPNVKTVNKIDPIGFYKILLKTVKA